MTDKGVYPRSQLDYTNYFDRVAASIEEAARNSASFSSLLKIARRGYEDACHKIICEERIRNEDQDNRFIKENTAKLIDAQEDAKKMKQELNNCKNELNKSEKENETIKREAARNYNLFKKSKEDNEKLQKLIKELKEDQKELRGKVSKLKDFETKFK